MHREIEGSEPAFPVADLKYVSDDGDNVIEVGTHGLTVREFACVHLKVPKTGRSWLDNLILESRRLDNAAAALAGVLANGPVEVCSVSNTAALEAMNFADALIIAGEEE